MLLCSTVGRAETASPNNPSLLLFGGTDLWRYGAFLYGGTLWSPAGLNSDGFTLKVLVNGGSYNYNSSTLQTKVDGTLLSGAALPGFRLVRDTITVGLFAGPLVQDYRLSPFDPGSRLRGLYAGAQFATDIWYQPSPNIMATLSGSLVSIGPTGYLRTALGYRVLEAAFIGPESAIFWCANFRQLEIGAHLTALRVGLSQWSAGAGWSMDTDRRSGPYLRLGVSAKY
jgi:hypothetical protein